MRVIRAYQGPANAAGRVLVGLAGVAALVAPLLEAAERNAVWINALAVLAYVGLERLAERRWPGRSLSLIRPLLLVQATQPLFLIVAFFLEGEVAYGNSAGHFSHADQAWLVALAGVAMFASALGGALLAGRGPHGGKAAASDVASSFSRPFMLLVSWLVVLHLATRLILLFVPREVPEAFSYGMRLYLSLFQALFVFLGMALRRGNRSARIAALASALTSLVVLLAGSRSDALFPILFMLIGYVVARPISRQWLIRGLVVATPLFTAAMFVGGIVREDERGRTGEAAVARFDDLGATISAGATTAAVATKSVRRMVSNSTHSVTTRIPKERPFEVDGLSGLPEEFANRILPRFNLSGISSTERPRHWMLNDLGFLVTWSTSVELTLVADAWYRGGALGLLVCGLILGFFLQGIENLTQYLMVRRPEYGAVLIFCLTSLLQIGARDLVAAIRVLLFLVGASVFVVGAARALEVRRRPGAMARRAPVPVDSPTHAVR